MYCDKCDQPVDLQLVEYMQQTKLVGNLLCSDCRGHLHALGRVAQA